MSFYQKLIITLAAGLLRVNHKKDEAVLDIVGFRPNASRSGSAPKHKRDIGQGRLKRIRRRGAFLIGAFQIGMWSYDSQESFVAEMSSHRARATALDLVWDLADSRRTPSSLKRGSAEIGVCAGQPFDPPRSCKNGERIAIKGRFISPSGCTECESTAENVDIIVKPAVEIRG